MKETARIEHFFASLHGCNEPYANMVLCHKLMAKDFAEKSGIPVPETIGVLKPVSEDDIRNYDYNSLPDSFVMKGALGRYGQAVTIVTGRRGEDFELAGGRIMTRDTLIEAACSIYNGKWSEWSVPVHNEQWKDIIFFEELLKPHPDTKPYLKCGMSDIRFGMHKLVPFHMLLRLSLEKADGKSNTHYSDSIPPLLTPAGYTTGETLVKPLLGTSETGKTLLGIKWPCYEEALDTAMRVQHAFRVNHCTLDIAITDRGPVFMEGHASTRSYTGADMKVLATRFLRIEKCVHEGRIKSMDDARDVMHDIFVPPYKFDFEEWRNNMWDLGYQIGQKHRQRSH